MNKLLSSLLLCLLASGSAFAEMDPYPDQMGMYFDAGATEYCVSGFFGQSFDVYFIYTQPTVDVY